MTSPARSPGSETIAPPRSASRRLRGLAANAALALASVVACLGAAELALRAAGYQYSPIRFVAPESASDYRSFHMGGRPPMERSDHPLTVFDPDLLWVPDRSVSAEINAQGYRGDLLPDHKDPADFLIVAFGDSNTLGPLNTADHWPGFLADMLRFNPSARRFRVVNAGVYGYASFQGVRRLKGMLRHRPDVAYFCFGANDAAAVRRTDREYAARISMLGFLGRMRLAAPFGDLVWRGLDRFRAPREPTRRVPEEEFRANAREFISLAREAGARPVLVTRPWTPRWSGNSEWPAIFGRYARILHDVAREQRADLIDASAAFRDAPELFTDATHFNRLGHRRMSEMLIAHLHQAGVLSSAETESYGSSVDMATADDRRLEIGPGWWFTEGSPGARGRWTTDRATLTLERHHAERALVLDVTTGWPTGRTRGTVLVNGTTAGSLPESGRHRLRYDLSAVAGNRVEVTFLVPGAVAPSRQDPSSRDERLLGVFVHSALLAVSPWRSGIHLGSTDVPEVKAGWYEPEVWASVRPGRWSTRRAGVRLGRAGGEKGLLVDWTFQRSRSPTTGHIEIDGRRIFGFAEPNGSRSRWIDLSSAAGDSLEIAFVVDEVVVPRSVDPDSPDSRPLGVFVHDVRLVRDAPGSGGEPMEPPGPLATGPLYASSVDLAAIGDGRPELPYGWYASERSNTQAPGRWSASQAGLLLERRGSERELVLEATFQGPDDWTTGHVDVEGWMAGEFRQHNGVARLRFDLAPFPGRWIAIRLVVDTPVEEKSGRQLGMFVHGVRLVPDPAAASTREAADLGEGLPADVLESGWWSGERWVDGTGGRWTGSEASIRLQRRPRRRKLAVDLSVPPSTGVTSGRLEVDGEAVLPFHLPEGRHTLVLDLPRPRGPSTVLRVFVDRPRVPERLEASGDRRTLGVFVHRVVLW